MLKKQPLTSLHARKIHFFLCPHNHFWTLDRLIPISKHPFVARKQNDPVTRSTQSRRPNPTKRSSITSHAIPPSLGQSSVCVCVRVRVRLGYGECVCDQALCSALSLPPSTPQILRPSDHARVEGRLYSSRTHGIIPNYMSPCSQAPPSRQSRFYPVSFLALHRMNDRSRTAPSTRAGFSCEDNLPTRPGR
jgi:hypothetical protein